MKNVTDGIKIPKISETEFNRRLITRKFEDIRAIKMIENFLLKKRGFVFNEPRRAEPVILLASGGLDSTIVWGILLQKYKVFPLFLDKKGKRKINERKAVHFFDKFYKKRFPDNYNPIQRLKTRLSPSEFEINPRNIDPQKLLEIVSSKTYSLNSIVPYLLPFYGVNYSYKLEYRKNIKIRTIFSAVTPGDGTVVPSQTFTSLRSTMFDMCLATQDYSWNFTSYAFERELNHWLEKSNLIKTGHLLKIPLEKTWSCYNFGIFQCGTNCLACHSRKIEFEKARNKR